MKKICLIIMVLMISVISLNAVMAVEPSDPGYDGSTVSSNLKTEVTTVWATVAVIVQILAVACVVFAGLRYMFAAPSEKADIKQGLIYLTIGAILVFSATSIINFVVTATKKVIK